MHSYGLATLGVKLHGFTARFDVPKEIGVEPCAGLYVVPGEDFVIAGRDVFQSVAPVLIRSAIVEAVATPAERRFGHKDYGGARHRFVVLIEHATLNLP